MSFTSYFSLPIRVNGCLKFKNTVLRHTTAYRATISSEAKENSGRTIYRFHTATSESMLLSNWLRRRPLREKETKNKLSPLAYCKFVVLRMVLCQCWAQSGRCGMCTSSGHGDGRRGATLAHYRRLSKDKDGRTE